MGVLLGILMLALFILVHELGHMLAARRLGVRVRSFCLGIGSGPIPGLGWKSPRTGTVYGIAPLPIGGMVDLKGMVAPKPYGEMTEKEKARHDKAVAAGEAPEPLSEDPSDDNFYTKPYWKKAVILAAGSLTNLLVAWLVLLVLSLTFLPLPDSAPVVGRVLPGSVAAKAGIVPGDRFVAYADRAGTRRAITEFSGIVAARDAGARLFLVSHAGRETTLDLAATATDATEGRKVLGVTARELPTPPGKALGSSFRLYGDLTSAIWQGYATLFSGNSGVPLSKAISGPVGIVRATSGYIDSPGSSATKEEEALLTPAEIRANGLRNFFFIWAAIAINLGLVNLLPLPPLDGGKLVEEAIRGPLGRHRRLRDAFRYVSLAVLGLLMGTMVLVTVNDVVRLFVR